MAKGIKAGRQPAALCAKTNQPHRMEATSIVDLSRGYQRGQVCADCRLQQVDQKNWEPLRTPTPPLDKSEVDLDDEIDTSDEEFEELEA